MSDFYSTWGILVGSQLYKFPLKYSMGVPVYLSFSLLDSLYHLSKVLD